MTREDRPVVAAVEGSLVDVVVPGNAGGVIRWEEQPESLELAREDPNPSYGEGERLWPLRFRALRQGTVVLKLVRERQPSCAPRR